MNKSKDLPIQSAAESAEDFRFFLTVGELPPPKVLDESIISRVTEDLNPSRLRLFTRIALIHFIVGFVSLVFICPQFGVSPLGHTALLTWLMHFGHEVCMVACGGIFLGGSALAMSVVLRPEEIQALRRVKLLQFGLLSLLSIGAFLCIGASVVTTLALFWIMGAVAGSMGVLELGWALRKRFALSLAG